MKKEEVMAMADAYRKKNGFLAGALVVNKDDVEKELLPLFKELYLDHKYEVVKDLITKDAMNAERVSVMGMGVVVTNINKPIHLARQTGRVSSLKPKGMQDIYMPVADITNSISTILKASFAFFDDVTTEDPVFIEFAKQCCIFVADAKSSKGLWEDQALPALNKVCEDFSNSPNFSKFLVKFFMCVMDFYWHSARLKAEDAEATDKKLFEKVMNTSGVLRGMPKEVRDAFLDHLKTYGMFPNIMDNEAKEDICC